MWTRKKPKTAKQTNTHVLALPVVGPLIAATHGEEKPREAKKVMPCAECHKRPAMALFTLTENQFGNLVESHKLLCGECGFTIGAKRRLVEDKDSDSLYTIPKYVKVEILHLL